IDDYGWFHTGDLGEVTALGLRIICRVDGLFKLTNGEKVSSLLIENTLTGTSRFIEQAVIIGAGREFIAALIFPNFRNLRSWASEQGKGYESLAEMLATSELRELFAQEVERQNAKLAASYCRVRAVAVVPKELTIESGELTPSLKVVRSRILEQYEDLVAAIYQQNGYDRKLESSIIRLTATKCS
ncbi:MAG: hypothetical protein HY692_05810, partial [Cyanobacteria bacterium NC_groundwater_1444_Ag_S-0.65um_54_12]|nr:hypothetical protein [Cyanobacteria bacterium NC_groundwater_1444_Ag_S-0.65um_54_12]